MKIGIIGAGHIGSTLATHFTKLNHDVSIANSRGPQTLKDVSKQTGAVAATIEDALMGAEVVVVTIPMNRVWELPRDLFDELPASTVVIDTCNYYPDSRDGTIPELEGKITESAYVERAIGRPVVKAFNNIMAPLLASRGLPPGSRGRIALPFAGDDEHAKKVVMELINAMGFDPVNAGSIADSWRQQQGMPVYCTNYDYHGVREGLAIANHRRLVELRQMNEALMKRLMAKGTPDQMVQAVRELHRREDHRKAG
jgi:predicted dinucleotide-binding enzyme